MRDIMNSTVPTLNQDNSLFNFHAERNGEACIEALIEKRE